MMDDTGFGTGLPGALLFFALFVLMVASMWRIFTKAGHPGWAALIPIYNIYILILIAGKPGWWLLLMLIPLVNIIIEIMVLFGVANKFGKGLGYTLGFLFLPYIFFPILAFGSSEYSP